MTKRSRNSLIRASLLGTTAVVVSACSLVLGIPGADEVKTDLGKDAAPDGVVADVSVADVVDDGVLPTDGGSDGDAACSADLKTDPANCGRCGRSCYGEACTNGKCAPHLIATGGQPENLRVASGYVYWTDYKNDLVRRIKTDGTGAQTVGNSTNGVSGPWGMVIDGTGTTIYIASAYGGKVHKCPVTGCASTAATVDNAASRPAHVELGGSNKIYYLDVIGNRVYENGINGGARFERAITDTAYNGGLLAAFTIDATHAYWSEPYNGIDNIKRAPLAGGATQSVVADGPRYPATLRIEGTKVWFVARGLNDNGGGVYSKNADGSGNTDGFAEGLNNPVGLHLDSTHVYWLDEGSITNAPNGVVTDGRVLRCPRSGCGAPEELANGQSNPVSLDSDGTDLFWADWSAGGKIYRLAK